MTVADLAERYRSLPTNWKLILGGVITGLSFPPSPLGFLAWVGLVPLIQAWLAAPGAGRSAFYGFTWSLGFLLVVIYWLALNTGTFWWAATLSMLTAVLVLSLNYAVIGWWFGWLYGRLGRQALWTLPFVWVSIEFLRSFGTLGFPWIALANGQTDYFLPIQNAAITGIYGLSFWVVMLNVLFVEVIHARNRRAPALRLGAALVAPWLSGILLLPTVPEPTLKVAVVQPNVNAQSKWQPEIRHQHFDQLARLTREVAVDSPAVVFWPEAATPAYLRRGGKRYLRAIAAELGELGVDVVTGMPDYVRLPDMSVEYFNSVGYIDSLGLLDEQYNKIHLVPMGEYIPLSEWFPFLKSLNLGQGNFTPGEEYTVFEVAGIPFSVGICFETTFPGVNRRFVRAGATFLVGVVNDAWYQVSSGPYQHAAQARYRAIELRRPMVRAANTGISVVYDQAGRVVNRLGLNREGTFTAMIAPTDELSFYARVGDLFAWLNVVLALGISGWLLARRSAMEAGDEF